MRSRASRANPFSLFAFQDIITSVTGIVILITMMLALELVHRKASSPQAKTVEISDTLGDALAQNQQEIERLQRIVDEGHQSFQFDADSLKNRLEELRKASSELQMQNAQLSEEMADARLRQEQLEQEAQQVTPQDLQSLQQELQTTRQQLQKLKQSNRVIFNRPEGEPKTPWLLQVEGDGILAAEVDKSMQPLRFASTQDFANWAAGQNSGAIYFVLLLKPSGVSRFQELRQTLRTSGFDIGYDLLSHSQEAIDPETGAGIAQ